MIQIDSQFRTKARAAFDRMWSQDRSGERRNMATGLRWLDVCLCEPSRVGPMWGESHLSPDYKPCPEQFARFAYGHAIRSHWED